MSFNYRIDAAKTKSAQRARTFVYLLLVMLFVVALVVLSHILGRSLGIDMNIPIREANIPLTQILKFMGIFLTAIVFSTLLMLKAAKAVFRYFRI